MSRTVSTLVAGVGTTIAVAFLYALVYAVADLYLSGHSMKPAWFDTAANVLLVLSAPAAGIGAGLVAWRASAKHR